MDNKEKYKFTFTFKGESKPTYYIVAHSLQQAIYLLIKKYRNQPIQRYITNGELEYGRIPFVTKEEPKPEKKKEYKQLSFKGFVDNQ
jgi:hypothetical protein